MKKYIQLYCTAWVLVLLERPNLLHIIDNEYVFIVVTLLSANIYLISPESLALNSGIV